MSTSDASPGAPIFDPAVLDEIGDGDAEFARSVIVDFLESTRPLRIALAEAVRSVDVDALQHCTHALKGSSFAIGAQPFGVACGDLEARARSGELDDIVAALERIDFEYSRLEPVLQALCRKAA